jgi:hypothetical protein
VPGESDFSEIAFAKLSIFAAVLVCALDNMNSERALRDQAWVGDAVLALYARRWLLRHTPQRMSDADRQQLFELFVSNQFLSAFGEPTQVEATIGRKFEQEGLLAAFTHIEKSLLESFCRSARKRGYALANSPNDSFGNIR